MSLSADEVKRIAELAKIKIDENNIEGYQKDLSGILDFVSELSDLPSLSEEEYRQVMREVNALREDLPAQAGTEHGKVEVQGQGLIEAAPEHRDGFVVSPHILTEKDNG